MQPLVVQPVTMSESIPAAVSIEPNDVPKKADAYCLRITTSDSRGATRGSTSTHRVPTCSVSSLGYLRGHTPASARPVWYPTTVNHTGTEAVRQTSSSAPVACNASLMSPPIGLAG